MLNSVSRIRLSADDRRRQLIGVGLSKLVEKPIQDLSIDEVAAEVGISRGLLFHYFPTKRDFYLACIAAAGRRILRNTAPDPDLEPADQVRAMVAKYVEQVDRRRDFYLSLVHGTGGGDVAVVEVYDGIRDETTTRVLDALALPAESRTVVHAWWAYVEDHALSWSAQPPRRRTTSLDLLVGHCVDALHVLLNLDWTRAVKDDTMLR
jgi:AcrR family transcriptional regulator